MGMVGVVVGGAGASGGLEAIRLRQFTEGGGGVNLHTSSRLKELKTPSGTNLHTATVQYLQQSIMEI